MKLKLIKYLTITAIVLFSIMYQGCAGSNVRYKEAYIIVKTDSLKAYNNDTLQIEYIKKQKEVDPGLIKSVVNILYSIYIAIIGV